MTLNEFKAWFEGFTEGMDGPPNEAQWKRIQERLATVTAISIQPQVIAPHPAPAVDPFRRIVGQLGIPANFERVTLTEGHNHCRPLDVGAVLGKIRDAGKVEASETKVA